MDYKILNNGVKIPTIGLGTWQSKTGEETYNAVKWALECGYRHIDSAYAYQNEENTGKAIKDSGINREEIFVTTKLPSDIKSYDGAIEYFNKSLTNLGLDYIDLYLIHAPWPWSNVGEDCTQGNIEAWKAMIDLYKQGKVKAIGVSNFQPSDIQPLIDATGVVPSVNQILFHIGNTQEHIYNYCIQNNILIEAYSPLATGKILENPKLQEFADKYNCSIADICLAYVRQRGTVYLPKSVHKERIESNYNSNIKLSNEDMDYLNNIERITEKKKLRS